MLASFRQRAAGARERMDEADCDLWALERTYRQFALVNAAIAGWRRVYRRELRPLLSSNGSNTLLDIGSGGGDVPRALARWAARDGLRLQITAIDADERAVRYARRQPPVTDLTFRQAMSGDLVREGQSFDLITSNHLLHHLSAGELADLLADCEALGRRTIHSDIERHPLAYAAFSTLTRPLFRGSFIREDGLTSIRRSYTAAELRALVPGGWTVQRRVPFRLLLTHDTHV